MESIARIQATYESHRDVKHRWRAEIDGVRIWFYANESLFGGVPKQIDIEVYKADGSVLESHSKGLNVVALTYMRDHTETAKYTPHDRWQGVVGDVYVPLSILPFPRPDELYLKVRPASLR